MIGVCVVVGLIVIVGAVFTVTVIWCKVKSKGILHCIIVISNKFITLGDVWQSKFLIMGALK